jgi:hypothetical protein
MYTTLDENNKKMRETLSINYIPYQILIEEIVLLQLLISSPYENDLGLSFQYYIYEMKHSYFNLCVCHEYHKGMRSVISLKGIGPVASKDNDQKPCQQMSKTLILRQP